MVAAPSLSAATILYDDFSVGTVGQNPAGWTKVDILTAGDYGNEGLRVNGANASNGTSTVTIDGEDFWLNGGRSTTYTRKVATMVAGETYTFTAWYKQVSSSYVTINTFFSDYQATAVVTSAANTLGGFSVGNGATPAVNGWNDLVVSYTATGADDGKDLYINLQSRRDVSTAITGWDNVSVTDTSVVPEPSSISLLGLAGLSLILRRRK